MPSIIRVTLLCVCFMGVFTNSQEQSGLQIENPETKTILISSGSDADSTKIYGIQKSENLTDWHDWLKTRHPAVTYPATIHESEPAVFFRESVTARSTSNDWTNQLHPADNDLWASPPGGAANGLSYVKFTMSLADDRTIWFQPTGKYPFHYQFARDRIPGLLGIPLMEYTRRTLYRDGQEYVLGSILRTGNDQIREMAIQFTGLEAFAAGNLAYWYQTVHSRIVVPHGWNIFYMPSDEQRQNVENNREIFEDLGIVIISPQRWVTENTCYSRGWNLGRIVYFPQDQILPAYYAGELKPTDILVTHGLPAEIPRLAGVITLAPVTPNSHVVILAQSFNLPMAYVQGEALVQRIEALYGRDVLLVVDESSEGSGECQIKLTDVTGRLTPEERQAILDLKKPPKVEITPMQRIGSYAVGAELMVRENIQFIGGKAANFGSLRRSIPDNSPTPALALTFDLWMDFLDQPFRNTDRTLREVISEVTSQYTEPVDPAQLHKDLYNVRKWITQGEFSATQKSAVMEALSQAGFVGNRKIRFRSSTNVEDTDVFSGAGLYDSFSGCLNDDLDNDGDGPSACDPTESNERGIFRAIGKVFASFYNDNAFQERLRHGINETDVGMAVLVHWSFPDDQELANGVATMHVTIQEDNSWTWRTELVQHPGAISVTNPEDSAQPEIAQYDSLTSPPEWVFNQWSSINGENNPVLENPSEYAELQEYILAAAREFRISTNPGELFVLDLEYKKMEPGTLVIKQIRTIPQRTVVPPPELDL